MGRGARARVRAEREAARAEYDWQWQLTTFIAFVGLGWFKVLWHVALGDEVIELRPDFDVPTTTAILMWTVPTLIGAVSLWWAKRR